MIKKKMRHDKAFGPLGFDAMSNKDSGYRCGDKFWHINKMIKYIKDNKIKIEKIHIPSMSLEKRRDKKNCLEMADIFLRIQKANTKYPVIIDWNGVLLDGYHRLARMISQGKIRIDAYRIILSDIEPEIRKEEEIEKAS